MWVTVSAIENLISRDPAHRRVLGLVEPGHLRLAALSLLSAKRVVIVSGFPVLSKGVGETDGPPGSLALGQALAGLGVEAVYLTDRLNAPLFEALGASPLETYRPGLLDELRPSHLVAIERPGRARDGRYHNMFGRDISHLVEPLDELFLEAERRGIVTIGIGDGGNEIGLGRVFKGVTKAVDRGRLIASAVATDYVIISGVSNWGAYGLVAALSALAGRDLLPGPEATGRAIQALLAAGAVDGTTAEAAPKVDGLPVERSQELIEELRALIRPSPLARPETVTAGVLGAGVSGLAAARLLRSRGARVKVSDLNVPGPPPDLAQTDWESGGHRLEFLDECDVVALSPGLPPDLPIIGALRRRSRLLLAEVELAFQLAGPELAAGLTAVTGSVGKRSTVELLGRILAAAGRPVRLGGNKGAPLAELVRAGGGGETVLALSSFQLENVIHFQPQAAVILGVGPDHLERHGDPSETLRVKSRVFMNQGPGQVLILNAADPLLPPLAEKHRGETWFFSTQGPVEEGAWLENGRIKLAWDKAVLDLGRAQVPHPANLLAAVLAALARGLEPEMVRGIITSWG